MLSSSILNVNIHGFALLGALINNTGWHQGDLSERTSFLAGSGLLLHGGSGQIGGGSSSHVTKLGIDLYNYGLIGIDLP